MWTVLTTVLLGVAGAALVALPTAPPAAAADLAGKVVLSPGGGYDCFRIPALVEAPDGSLLLFAEARKPSCGDTGTHDVVVTRSTNDGSTWSPIKVVHTGGNATAHNPTPIVDHDSGRVVLLTTRQYRTVWSQHSTDNGVTWSEPEEITGDVKLSTWNGMATGPSHGIQLTRGAYDGRLVAGVHYTTDGGQKGGALVYSTDGGDSWRLGAHDHAADPSLRVQELSVFENPNGSLYVFARDEGGSDSSEVASAVATDGGTRFTTGFHAGAVERALASPVVQASTLALRATDQGDRYNRALLASPTKRIPNSNGELTRGNLTIRSTFKAGTEWVDPGGGKVIYSGMSAYTDLTLIDGDRVGLAYERATNWSHGYIWFTSFTEADLGLPDGNTGGLPSTPDSSANGLDAFVRGATLASSGKYGRSLTMDGDDDYVQLPFAEKLAVSSGDFTWTAWFRYGASTADQPLIWAYNQGDVYSQLWLRAEPARGRIRALAQSGENAVTVSTTKAHNDNAWHHIALRRDGATFTIHVDGAVAATATSAAVASVSPKRPFQIHLGQRLDGAQNLRGSLDEVRLYDRALSAEEIGRIHAANASITDGLLLRLPLDSTA